jgi:hypothetical protein
VHFKGNSNNEIEGEKNMAEKPLQTYPSFLGRGILCPVFKE